MDRIVVSRADLGTVTYYTNFKVSTFAVWKPLHDIPETISPQIGYTVPGRRGETRVAVFRTLCAIERVQSHVGKQDLCEQAGGPAVPSMNG